MKRSLTPKAPAGREWAHPAADTRGRALAILLLLLSSPGPAVAIDFNGSALVAATATDNRGVESDLLEQRYNFSLLQDLTPYLRARFGYQFQDYSTTFAEGVDTTRRIQRPLFELLYRRERLAGRIAIYDQLIENSPQQEDLERRSFAASLGWRPSRGPGFSIRYLDTRNVADVSVFGQDVDSQLLDLIALYNGKSWSATYSYEQRVVDNRSNQLRSDQNRHQIRGDAYRSFWGDRLSLGVSGSFGRVNRTSEVSEETELAEPVPASEGLAAVDTSPEIGELQPNPTLVDGDIQTPASPPIDIGGANTFRNLGLDLGITRPISRLEIAVDEVSGPQLSWRVYQSRDNLAWEEVAGVTSFFDEGLLRYRLRFPETEDRFFKAVNVSVNPAPVVLVTEVRALLDVTPDQLSEDIEGTLYRADVIARFRPSRRVSGSVGAGLSNDEDLAAGLVRRDYSEYHADARLTIDLRRDLTLNFGYQYTDSEELRGTVLLRTLNRYYTALNWFPLPTVEAVLAAGRRDESEAGDPIQTLDSVRLGLITDLLPDLRLISDLDYSRLDDPFAGRDRDTWSWRETLQMQPLPTWTLSGSFYYSLTETREGEALLERTQYSLDTRWAATHYLVLGATLYLGDEDGRRSLNQSYHLSYSPGEKLSISANYQGFDSSGDVATSTDSLGVAYRLYRNFTLFANLSRSRTEVTDGETTQITSLRAGMRLSF